MEDQGVTLNDDLIKKQQQKTKKKTICLTGADSVGS